MNKRKAFTLVELLVVIAIIAVLMGVLIPTLNIVKSRAETLACRANIRSYGLVMTMYLNENGGRYPHPDTGLYVKGKKNYLQYGEIDEYRDDRWHNAAIPMDGPLFDYLRSKKINLCKTFVKTLKKEGCTNCGQGSNGIPIDPQYSYTQNFYIGMDWPIGKESGGDPGALQEHQVRNAAGVFIFTEENSWDIPGLSSTGINDTRFHLLGDGNSDAFATYHNAPGGDLNAGYANVLFADGHAGIVQIGREEIENGDADRLANPKVRR